MAELLQPVHLMFILLIVLILFGPGKPSELGRGLAHTHFDQGRLFMAKGVDPSVGRDVGDMLPDKEARRHRIWARVLVATVLGNLLYFASRPLLPMGARLSGETVSVLPALVDIWLCVLIFGALNLVRPSSGRSRKTKAE